MPTAQDRLEQMGWHVYFRPVFGPRHADAVLKIYHHMVYWHPLHRCTLELHWRTRWETPDRTAHQWAQSAASVWEGLSYRSLSPVDLALHLCEHGSGHAWFRSKWLGDLARMHVMNYVDWDTAYRSAHTVGAENSLLQCLRLLEELYGLPVPETLRAPAGRLPAALLDRVATCMLAPPETHRTVRQLRYERLLRPRRSWRQAFREVAYSSADFELLQLPDRLFWVYLLLRPFLLAWRWLSRVGPKPHREVARVR
jgi:hypothetical protein